MTRFPDFTTLDWNAVAWDAMQPDDVLGWAMQSIEQGNMQALQHIVPHTNPRSNDSLLLRWSAECGSIQAFKYLLPLSDPLARNSEALFWAIFYDRSDMFEMLLPVCDLAATLDDFDSDFEGRLHTTACQILESRAQNQRLSSHVLPSKTHTQRKM